MRPKGRPKKYRRVKDYPLIRRFSPRGRAGRPDEVNLAMDEFEALRLADYKGLSQKEAARSMQVSQQTFSRILNRARRIISDILINGKIVKIQGGQCIINSYKDSSRGSTQQAPASNIPKK